MSKRIKAILIRRELFGSAVTATEPKRSSIGTCPVCARRFLLKTNGTLRHHGDSVSYPAERCPGAGQKPTTDTEGDQP